MPFKLKSRNVLSNCLPNDQYIFVLHQIRNFARNEMRILTIDRLVLPLMWLLFISSCGFENRTSRGGNWNYHCRCDTECLPCTQSKSLSGWTNNQRVTNHVDMWAQAIHTNDYAQFFLAHCFLGVRVWKAWTQQAFTFWIRTTEITMRFCRTWRLMMTNGTSI